MVLGFISQCVRQEIMCTDLRSVIMLSVIEALLRNVYTVSNMQFCTSTDLRKDSVT
jgi:hypothetical protein